MTHHASPADTEAVPESKTSSPSLRRPSKRLLGLVVVVAAGLGVGGVWLFHQLTHVVVTDARIAADMITVSSRVPGWIVDLSVTEGDHLDGGAVLLRVDDRDTRLRLKELDARLAVVEAHRTEIKAQVTQTDQETHSRIAAREAAVTAASATLAGAQARLDLATAENSRAVRLVSTGAGTKAHVDQTTSDLEAAHQDVRTAQARLTSAEADLEEARAERGALAVLNSQLAGLEPEARALEAQRDRLALDQADRILRMPLDGVVDRVFVDAGEYVDAGQRLLMVHDPDAVRVEANVKETSLRFLKPGAEVQITVDAVPGRTFTGTVDRLGHAATSEFALLPSPNPSGNFTKITQRLPVRIALPQVDGLLKPGMMVEVEARAGD
ncbi:HlyD family secretion protein [Roseospira marina]|uniref:HlyD family secretion protein n=1 Tax=Roseospira marina TaxID=140057 RepID=A0A5M6IFN1_9PROT|nr:HlyD family secretion protein [Roseospira marina]KAA5607106.1 HlyD family secretion protein [Roseospira marina]MBB4312700.1 membrane fusion protein (multidrug efflux system) [Roseospira marina]MBB5086527.1 membrane fusion protein (multidrug efflux system) [Roseospira marina]